ncbi:MAG: hypothetical protein ABR593_08845, partial [Candidatus Limnocylindria bacterium]
RMARRQARGTDISATSGLGRTPGQGSPNCRLVGGADMASGPSSCRQLTDISEIRGLETGSGQESTPYRRMSVTTRI